MSTGRPSHGVTLHGGHDRTLEVHRGLVGQVGIDIARSGDGIAAHHTAIPEPAADAEVGVAVVGAIGSELESEQAGDGHVVEIQDIALEGTGSLQPAQGVDNFEEGPIGVGHEAEVVLGEAALGCPAVVVLSILQEQVHVELLVGVRVVHHAARDPARTIGVDVELHPVGARNEVVTCAEAHGFEVAEPEGPVVSWSIGRPERVTHDALLVEFHMGRVVDGSAVTACGGRQIEGRQVGRAVDHHVRGDGVECRKAGAVATLHQELLGKGKTAPNQERAGRENSCRHDT